MDFARLKNSQLSACVSVITVLTKRLYDHLWNKAGLDISSSVKVRGIAFYSHRVTDG